MSVSLKSAVSGLEGFISPASRITNYISLGFLLIMPLPVFFDVIGRFAFRGAIPGGVEIESYMLLIIVFLGLAFIGRGQVGLARKLQEVHSP